MNRFVVASLLLVAANAHADTKTARRALVDALSRGDSEAVAKQTTLPLSIISLWFDREDCKQFSSKKRIAIDKDQLPVLVGCIHDLGVRETTAWMKLVVGPGAPFIAVFRDDQLTGLYGMPPVGDSPMIDPTELVAHVKDFRREILPDRKTKNAIDAAGDTASIRALVCIDARGKVTADIDRPAGFEAYANKVKATLRAWKAKPFVVQGKAIRACTMASFGYPEARLDAFELPRMESLVPLLEDSPAPTSRSN